jgi:hypothetical protein
MSNHKNLTQPTYNAIISTSLKIKRKEATKMLEIGTTRLTLLIGAFAFKIPRIRILDYAAFILRRIVFFAKVQFGLHIIADQSLEAKRMRWNSRWKDLRQSFRWALSKEFALSGILENIREAKCYLRTKSTLLARLYLPLVIVNAYRREDGVGNFDFGNEGLMRRVIEESDREYIIAFNRCSHTFDNPRNFSCCGRRVKILDYGEAGIEDLIVRYGDRVEKLLISATKGAV